MSGYKDPPKHSQFKKADPRINRKGRPKDFKALRALAQQIAQEPHPSPDAKSQGWTRVEVMLRGWIISKDPTLQKAFMEIAYGKVKDEAEHSGEIKLRVIYESTRAYTRTDDTAA